MKLLRFKEFEDFRETISVGDILVEEFASNKNEKSIITHIDIVSSNEVAIDLLCFASDLGDHFKNKLNRYFFSKRTWNYFYKKIMVWK